MKLSIIIVSWNTRDLLKKCIESILKYSSGEYEIIVVDNASFDGTVEMLESLNVKGLNFEIIKNSKNLGFAKANNQGIRIAKGEYILLLNPDTEFVEEFQVSNLRLQVAILGCKLLNSDKTIQPSVRRFPRVMDILVILFKLHKLFPNLLDRYLAKDFNYSKSSEVDQVMGAFFLVPRNIFDKIGLLDEGYFIWFEEVDFCRRAKKAGYKIMYYPGTQIIHHGSQSFNQAMTLKKQWWFFRSAARYFFF